MSAKVGIQCFEQGCFYGGGKRECVRGFRPMACPLRGFPALLAKRGAIPNSPFAKNANGSDKGSLHPRFAAMLGCANGLNPRTHSRLRRS